jgi:hypothetical protein
MNDKHIGLGLIFTSAIVYLGHFIMVACYAITQTSWDADVRMRFAAQMIGHEPRYWAFIGLAFGLCYLSRAELRERRMRRAQAHGQVQAEADLQQSKTETLEKDTWKALTLLKAGKLDEAKSMVDSILES